MRVPVVNLALNRMLPPEMRDSNIQLDKKGVEGLMLRLAKERPELYPAVAQFLSEKGAELAYSRGETFRLEDFKAPSARAEVMDGFRRNLDRIENSGLSGKDLSAARADLFAKTSEELAKRTSEESLRGGNNIAMTVLSGARGKAPQLRDLISSPGFYTDEKGDPIPWFIDRSFAEGLSTADFLAGTYAARAAVTECLEEGTEVRMADGSTKPIQDIRPGDMVVGADTKGVTRPVVVKSLFNKGEQEVWEFNLRFSNSNLNGLKLRATGNHKMLLTDTSGYSRQKGRYQRGNGSRPDPARLHDTGILEAKMLGVGRRRAVMPAGGEWEGGKEEPYGFLLGLLLGDGCVTQRRVTFSCADPLLIEHVSPKLEALDLKITKSSPNPEGCGWYLSSTTYLSAPREATVKGVQGFKKGRLTKVNRILEGYGMWGKYSWQKTLPRDIWTWRSEDVIDLIACYFACDGCVSTGYHKASKRDYAELQFASTSDKLLTGIKDILLTRFGISSGKLARVTSGGFSTSPNPQRVRPCYSLRILRTGCIKKFARIFGPSIPGVKRERIAKAAELIQLKDNNPYPKASLSEKTLVGMRPCWDIEVDHPDHLFLLANGLIVSNSKNAVAKGGFLAKTRARANSTNMVTTADCGTSNGIDLPPDEKDLRGRVLQQDAGGVGAGSVITRGVYTQLQKSAKPVLVRSPLTCEAPVGVCAKCMGVGATGRFPSVGDHVGMTASNAEGEPLAQGALNCLKSGTYVRMADLSTRKIEEILPGEWVLGADVGGNTFPVRVLSTWDQGLQPVQRYTYAMGQTKQRLVLECTEIHELLSNKKSFSQHNFDKHAGAYGYGQPENFQAYKLPAGYKNKDIAAVLPVSCSLPELVSEPLAALCGVLLGDGIRWGEHNPNATPRFSCADPELIADLNILLESTGCRASKEKRSYDYSLNRPREAYCASPTDNPIKAKLREWGLAGCYALDKRLPREAWTWDDASLGSLIAGFIAADGSVGKNKDGHVFASFGSTSKGMLEDLKELLALRLCVYSSALTRTAKAGTGNHKNDAWAFTITRQDQLLKLQQALGVIPGCKHLRFERLLGEATYVLRNAEPFYRARRKTVEQLGTHPTWDISVDHPDQLFVLANGLIVSNTKHVTSGTGAKKEFSGLDYIVQFTESPEEFKDRTVVAPSEGAVRGIREAPQGGFYATVGDEEVYIPPDRKLLVKEGDVLEAGDALTDGLTDPEDVINYKGLGEGRRYYAERLGEMAAASGAGMDRRLHELLARTAVDHLELDDPEEEGYLPSDTVSFNDFVHKRRIPEDTHEEAPDSAVGKYLQQNSLHYSAGTRITPSVAKRLKDVGIPRVAVSAQEPGFKPVMMRLQQAASFGDDWLARLGGSYLGRNLEDSRTRALDTNIESNPHPVPRLAVAVGYGDKVDKGKGF